MYQCGNITFRYRTAFQYLNFYIFLIFLHESYRVFRDCFPFRLQRYVVCNLPLIRGNRFAFIRPCNKFIFRTRRYRKRYLAVVRYLLRSRGYRTALRVIGYRIRIRRIYRRQRDIFRNACRKFLIPFRRITSRGDQCGNITFRYRTAFIDFYRNRFLTFLNKAYGYFLFLNFYPFRNDGYVFCRFPNAGYGLAVIIPSDKFKTFFSRLRKLRLAIIRNFLCGRGYRTAVCIIGYRIFVRRFFRMNS